MLCTLMAVAIWWMLHLAFWHLLLWVKCSILCVDVCCKLKNSLFQILTSVVMGWNALIIMLIFAVTKKFRFTHTDSCCCVKVSILNVLSQLWSDKFRIPHIDVCCYGLKCSILHVDVFWNLINFLFYILSSVVMRWNALFFMLASAFIWKIPYSTY